MLSGRKTLVALILLALTVSLSACGQSAERPSETTASKPLTGKETATNGKADPLAGTERTLRSLRGEAVIANAVTTLEFDKNEYGGFAGCNWYGGKYGSEGGSLNLYGGSMTSMGNPSVEACQQESTYVDTLPEVVSYRVQENRLELRDPTGEAVLAFTKKPSWESDPAELVNTRWKLHSLNGRSPEKGSTPTLSFGTEGHYAGYDGCRNFAGLYVANEKDLAFEGVSMKDRDCMKPVPPEDVGRPVGSIPAAGDYRLDEGRLEILAVDGNTYIFVLLTEDDLVTQETTPWTLERFIENSEATRVLQETEITIAFDRGTLRKRGSATGSSGCNEYSADYVDRSYANSLEGPNFEDFTVTRKLCRSPEGVMDQERRYLNVLEDVRGYYQKTDGRLYLETSDGRKLVFAASG